MVLWSSDRCKQGVLLWLLCHACCGFLTHFLLPLAFPPCCCFQATFVILLEAPAHLSILSNMPEASRRPCSSTTDSVCVEFLPSPPMSTYLVAIAVGDMQSVSANMGR